MGAHNRNSRAAVIISVISFTLFLIAFVTPYWLVTDGQLKDPQFENLGLWEICLNNFHDIHRFYSNPFTGCGWVFDEEYYIIHGFLLPGFYIAVQLFATLCFVMCLVALPLTIIFLRTSRDDDRFVMLLLSIGICQSFASLFGFIAVVIFGAWGDSRDWMPHWQNNDMGWSFALAVVGSVFLLPAGVLYIIQARRERYRRLNELSNREAISEYDGSSKGDDYYQRQQAAQQYFAPEPSSRPRRPPVGGQQRAQTSSGVTSMGGGGIQTDI